MKTPTIENDGLTTEQLLALKLADASEALAGLHEKFTSLVENSQNKERALELLHKYQGKIEALAANFERIVEFEEDEGNL